MALSMTEAVRRFTEEEAERLFRDARWPNGVACDRCGSLNIASRRTRRPAPYRCRDCRRYFSVRTGTVMQASNLPLRTWALAMYLLTSHPKGVSSLQLARDLGVTQKTAWHLAHRIRQAWASAPAEFTGPVEVDEAYVGRLEKNKHSILRHRRGGGSVGKAIPVGARDRATGRSFARVIDQATYPELIGFIREHAAPTARVYTDNLGAYRGMPFRHSTVNHTARQYVDGDVWTNGIESIWATLKRGYSWRLPPDLARSTWTASLCEFTGRLNDRHADTLDQMGHMAAGMAGKRLRYADLIAPPVAPVVNDAPYVPPPGLVDALVRYLRYGTRPSAWPSLHSLDHWRASWRRAGMPPLD